MRLYANIKIYDTNGFENEFCVKEEKVEKAISKAIEYVNKKHTRQFWRNIKKIIDKTKEKIKDE
jgi:hypothetical protein